MEDWRRLKAVREKNGITDKHLFSVRPRFGLDGPQDHPDYRGDCSSGCRFFVNLEEGFAGDWGVCTNPNSYRCGMLTFEHDGCLQFEYDEEWDKEFCTEREER